MICFKEMLIEPARQAGISTPEDIDNYNPEEYLHWHVYTLIQLGSRMPDPSSHWNNAKIISEISRDDLLKFAKENRLGEVAEMCEL